MSQVRESGLLGGRVRLRQPATGYRAGMDAALLAAAVGVEVDEWVIEAGCGAGGALMQVAARCLGAHVVGLERDPLMADLARENAALNGMADRAEVVVGDVAAGFRALDLPPFDWAISNPPFFDDPGAMRAPGPGKRDAWMADDGLEAWTRFLLKAVREGGRIVVIHRADRLADLLALLGDKAGSFAIRPIHPFADQPAKRVLVQAIKTGKAPLRLLPPLVMHERGSETKHTLEAEAILRGEARLGW
ncbi:tRNA1(Val) (adenine(37)-N6)-methyltransferase [Brevundimonas sp. PAMC22021]|uniref:tRNA1(Val) (adenine(37)-N6)-methyltransferase n=1 Tax=Brevundimonas sp. PAMC22021 TaxID=2861285 RepID=UPI001C63A24A|nr:methyltransferase domain-containing protein [Brevundimonas sp. PAMC22021]QYF87704.1 methyltransferase domain-containing protein [Brevundimonas sp. PAMC22021]